MPTPRLPQPGSDQGDWGTILNQFLLAEHNPDGSHKDSPGLQTVITNALNQAIQNQAVLTNGGSTITGQLYWRGPDDATQIVAKPLGDNRAGVFDLIHNDTKGYLFHLIAGPNSQYPGTLMAMGLDNNTTSGLLIANKAAGMGIRLDQRGTVTASDAYGFYATQRSQNAPLVRLELQDNNGADVMQLLAFNSPAATKRLLYVGDPSGYAGGIFAANGQLEWRRNLLIMDKDASTTSAIDLTDNSGVTEGSRTHTLLKKTGLEFYAASGTPNLWWPFRLVSTSSHLKISTGSTTGTVGSATWSTTIIDIQNGKLSFFDAAPIAKPTITGSRANTEAALKNLLTALALYGLITDSTTA